MKRILAIFLFALSFNAHALYYCKCDTGAHASCSAGSDANNGTSGALAKVTLPDSDALNAVAAGTTVNLCEGGKWANATGWLLQNSNLTLASPLAIQTYAPASGATGRAILESASGATAQWIFGGFNNTTPHGGYVLRNLEITKAGSPSGTGITFYGASQGVLLENLRVWNWANGMEVTTTQNIRYLKIRGTTTCDRTNSTTAACAMSIDSNCQNGIIGSATDYLVENVLIENNNPAAAACGSFTLQHGTYTGGVETQARITFRNNIYRNNSLTGGVCGSGNATFRGNVDQVTFEGNLIQTPGGNSQCIGLSVQDGYGSNAECMHRFVARGNTVIDGGSSAMLFRLTPGLLVENNQILQFATTGTQNGINVANPGSQQDLDVCPAGDAIVRNNTGYYDSGSGGTFVSVNAGTGHQVFNNAVKVTANGAINCWAHAGATFTTWNNNWCYELGSGQWSATYSTLAAAQAAGFDANGGNSDPLLAATPTASSPSLAVQSGSPLRSAGRNTDKAPRDVLWCQRDSTPDIGAHEYGGSPCLTIRSPVLK